MVDPQLGAECWCWPGHGSHQRPLAGWRDHEGGAVSAPMHITTGWLSEENGNIQGLDVNIFLFN